MRRTFYPTFRKRIPRKLKKAAKYGVVHRTIKSQFPPRIEKTEDGGFKCVVHENNYWIIRGRRTKHKLKVCNACKKEYEEFIKEMYKRNMECVPNWLFDNKSRA